MWLPLRGPKLAVLACAALALAGCETGDEPIESTYLPEDPRSRAVQGHLRRGHAYVEGATVHIDAAPGYAIDPFQLPTDPELRTVTTDLTGGYYFQAAPFRYELTIRDGRELFAFRELTQRYVEPALAEDGAPHAFAAKLAARVEPPPPPGDAVAFFISGVDALGSSGDPAAPALAFERFSSVVTLHALEYPKSGGVSAGVAYGHADVRVDDGAIVTAVVHVDPIGAKPGDVTFSATPPKGMTAGDCEMRADFGLRTSAVTFAPIPLGETVRLTPVPGIRYSCRVRASRPDGATSDSGQVIFAAFEHTKVELPLIEPPVLEGPISGVGDGVPSVPSLEPGGVLRADADGPREHVLTPLGHDGTAVHVVTRSRVVALPDATVVGAAPPEGRYRWTVTSWKGIQHVYQVFGPDMRAATPSATSAPQIIDVR